MIAEALALLNAESFTKGVRLLGLTLSNFLQEERQIAVQLTIEF